MEIIKKRTAQNAEKKAKQELDDNRERILFHLENSPLGYIEWDKDGLVKMMSKRAEEIFGYTEQEFKETIRSGYSLVYGPDLEFTLEIGKQLISGIIDNNLSQCRNITKDGRIIWCEWFHSTLKNKSGKVTSIMSLAQDITERKRSVDETLRLVDNLQKKNRELRQFSYMVSHNLRAPIIKIQGLAKVLNSNSVDENIKSSLVENIHNEALNLDNIVKDINTIITAQESDSKQKVRILFQSKIDQVRQVLEIELAESGAVIKTDFSEADGVFTVRSFLYSVFYNLISNAIKYRRQEEYLHIDISSKLTEDFTCIIVSDNGSGIDLAKHRNKIFGLYKRFHDKEIQGRGIGLHLVKTQIESLGGRIEVESTVGKGTTFKIYIPNIKN